MLRLAEDLADRRRASRAGRAGGRRRTTGRRRGRAARASVLTANGASAASSAHRRRGRLPGVCTTTGTSSASGAPGWVCSITTATSKPPPVDSRRSLSDACSRAAPGLLDVVGEEPAEVLPRDGLERLRARRRTRPASRGTRGRSGPPTCGRRRRRAAPEHVEDHQRLPVADRLGRGAVARAELGEREVAPVAHVAAVLLQRVAAVLLALPPLLLDQVVGQVGGQPLAPVPARVVDEDRVAPPVVEDLVRVGGASG